MEKYTVIYSKRIHKSISSDTIPAKELITCNPENIWVAITEAGIDDGSVSFIFHGHCKDV